MAVFGSEASLNQKRAPDGEPACIMERFSPGHPSTVSDYWIGYSGVARACMSGEGFNGLNTPAHHNGLQ